MEKGLPMETDQIQSLPANSASCLRCVETAHVMVRLGCLVAVQKSPCSRMQS